MNDESTPMVRPTRLEMAPHAKLGLKVSVGFAMSIILMLHSSLVIVGGLNTDAVCEYPLASILIWYGVAGLTFVAILSRGWIFFSELGAWPDRGSFVLGLINFVILFIVGLCLTDYTYKGAETCRLSAPILYRWCFATSLFFVILCALLAFVPCVRLVARCMLAPIAFCLVACVEKVVQEVDIDVPEVELPELGKFQMPGIPLPDNINIEIPTITFRLGFFPRITGGLLRCLLFPLLALLELIRLIVMSIMGGACLTLGGCYRGCILVCQSCFHDCQTPHALLHCAINTALGAGCLSPGRSLVALFVNTTAQLWFFIYFLIEVRWNWGLECDKHIIGLGPSPLHSFVFLWGLSGTALTLGAFLYDIFVPPQPPPRSQLEAASWRVRRRAKIVGYIFLLVSFLVLGAALFWYTLESVDCPALAPAVYRMAWLIVLIWLALLALLVLLVLLTVLDCCITGRLRLIVVLTNKHYGHQQPSASVPSTTGTIDPEGARFFIGASEGDVERLHRDGDEVDRLTNWTVDANYGEHRVPPKNVPVGAGAAVNAPQCSSMQRPPETSSVK